MPKASPPKYHEVPVPVPVKDPGRVIKVPVPLPPKTVVKDKVHKGWCQGADMIPKIRSRAMVILA